MSLQEYRQKRDFQKTREPRGAVSHSKDPIFVVQEHWASHHHYDFRLEAFGTLKSWAVPKGPSSEVGDKRLAVEVEDHPLGYATFKGRIPEGEYGAGIVKIWDHGHWKPPEDLSEAFDKGHLEFELRGKKLKGKWLLQRTSRQTGQKNQWLLIKRHDAPAPKKVARPLRKNLGPLPKKIEAQLALLVDEVPHGPDWIFEIKLDGYRTFTLLQNNKPRFLTRHGLDWTEKYQQLVKPLQALKVQDAIFDGEIVALDDKGRSNFADLQLALKNKTQNLVYCIFDLLHLNGEDLRARPLEERKQLLKKILPKKSGPLRLSEHWRDQGEELFRHACEQGLEGVIAKRRDQPYRATRGGEWRKIKCSQRQELVIGGYTEPAGRREHFGALLVGVQEKGGLRYAGRVGTGFSQELLQDLLQRLHPLKTGACPFEQGAPGNTRGVHWVRPDLVAEIEFKTWTHDNLLRQASFMGLREDKKATQVQRETAAHPPLAPNASKAKKDGPHITHPDRVIYAKENITKMDLARYYKTVAPWLIPFVLRRPLSLIRCVGDDRESCFFQKHLDHRLAPASEESKIEGQKVLAIHSAEGLMELVQYGVLEFHAWQCTLENPLHPDQLVFDLDPDESLAWSAVQQAAVRLRELLDDLHLRSFVKTTGGKGLHVQVPIEPRYSWDQTKVFCKTVVEHLTSEYPKDYLFVATKKRRAGKIFLDYLRNGLGATAVAPYSLRSKDQPAVSTPLTWEELKRLADPKQFDIHSVLQRLARAKDDPWPDYWKLKQKIQLLK